jgi:hypothetical protein
MIHGNMTANYRQHPAPCAPCTWASDSNYIQHPGPCAPCTWANDSNYRQHLEPCTCAPCTWMSCLPAGAGPLLTAHPRAQHHARPGSRHMLAGTWAAAGCAAWSSSCRTNKHTMQGMSGRVSAQLTLSASVPTAVLSASARTAVGSIVSYARPMSAAAAARR